MRREEGDREEDGGGHGSAGGELQVGRPHLGGAWRGQAGAEGEGCPGPHSGGPVPGAFPVMEKGTWEHGFLHESYSTSATTNLRKKDRPSPSSQRPNATTGLSPWRLCQATAEPARQS